MTLLRRKALLILKLTISLGFLSVLLFRQDLAALLTSIGQTDVALFSTALLLSAVTILIRAYKWQLLLQIQGARVPLNTIHSLSYMALFFNNFFLGSLGGDTFKIYRTQGFSTTKSGAAAAVLAERLTGIVMLILVVLSSYVIFLESDTRTLAEALPHRVVIAGLFCLIFAASATKIFLKAPRLRNSTPLVKRISELLIYHVDIHKSQVYPLSLCMLLSLIYYIISIVSMYFFALSADVHVSLLDLAFIVPLSMLIIMLPISVNGLGIQESAFAIYFAKLGVESSSALTVALLPRIGMYIFSVVGGIIYLVDCLQKR